MNITRKILYNFFKDIAEKHLQIHSFFWGDVPDAFGRQDIIFPLMIVTPNSVSMNLGEVSHSYTVTILDRLIDGDTNKVDVDSDCFQYYRDVVAQLDRLNQVDFGIEFPMTPEPVQDVSPHLCYGFQGEMLINVDENYDQCAVPSEPISFDPTLVCLPASYVVKYANDVIIEQGTIPSGGSVVVIVPDAQDATWELRDTDGVLIDSGAIPSGGSATIVAPDGVVDVRDTDGNTLYSVSVVSGGSAIQVVGDSSVEVRNSLNVVVDSGVVKAEGSGVFNAPDATFTINGDASFSPIPSGGAENVLVENTNGTPVGAFDGNSNSWVIPDQTIEVNTVNEGAIPSVGTIEIDITDGTNPVTPNDVTIVGRKVTVEVPSGGGSLAVDFTVDDATPDTNQTITFTDATVGATSWVWDFGDGTSSILQNPTKKYAHSGVYTVTLCASDGTSDGVEVKSNFITCSLQPLPSANLQMHNQALIGATPTNATLVSGAISQWDDAINAYHRTQGTPANRPTYLYPAVTAPNGVVYGAARFDGSNDFLQNSNAGFTRSTGSFEVLVFKSVAFSGSVRVFLESASATNSYELYTSGLTPTYGLFNGAVANNVQGFQMGVWSVLYIHWNGASSFIDWNNKSRRISPTSPNTNSAIGSTIAATYNGLAPNQIDVLEHIVYTAKPSDADITLIQERIVAQYGNIF